MPTDKLNVDPDMRWLLDRLKAHYTAADDGHIIRAVLRERLRRVKRLYKLEGPDLI